MSSKIASNSTLTDRWDPGYLISGHLQPCIRCPEHIVLNTLEASLLNFIKEQNCTVVGKLYNHYTPQRITCLKRVRESE